MLTIEMLPVANGDCLWIECGDPGDTHRILIDGGSAKSYAALEAKLAAASPEDALQELLRMNDPPDDMLGDTGPLDDLQQLADPNSPPDKSVPNGSSIVLLAEFGGGDAGLHVNYRSKKNEIWDNPRLKRLHRYTTAYPAAGADGLLVSL